ncbi:helix-turn-helix transcriptional regulator [Pseudomonas congelans]|uniref:helix-turn-helix transcriptional regulator n=1 Tax=Pseudomonas congelans TaxID=200452 RepID=UPI001BDC7168|nr:AlpA family phage regulatory protein [Pseudomonas congelans]QVX09222.1 AlpA family phage regulatory protein [Pseudomonas congelans]
MNSSRDVPAIEFIRLPEVKRLTGLSAVTICRLGEFPWQIKIGEQAVAWIKSGVLVWSLEKVKAARKPHEGS